MLSVLSVLSVGSVGSVGKISSRQTQWVPIILLQNLKVSFSLFCFVPHRTSLFSRAVGSFTASLEHALEMHNNFIKCMFRGLSLSIAHIMNHFAYNCVLSLLSVLCWNAAIRAIYPIFLLGENATHRESATSGVRGTSRRE